MKNSNKRKNKSVPWLAATVIFILFLGWQSVKYAYTGVVAFSQGELAMGIFGAIIGYRQWRKERARNKKTEQELSNCD